MITNADYLKMVVQVAAGLVAGAAGYRPPEDIAREADAAMRKQKREQFESVEAWKREYLPERFEKERQAERDRADEVRRRMGADDE